MDPVANLKEQLELAEYILSKECEDVDDLLLVEKSAKELAELVQAMDEWRKNGGFDPYAKKS